MSLTYLSDLYEMYVNEKFYEGYIFVIKIFMFDVTMIVPLIIALVIKNTTELKIWGILSVVFQNFVLALGFKVGAIYAVSIGMLMTIAFIAFYKKFDLKDDTTNNH